MRIRELVSICATLCACDPQIRSERGDFTLVFPGLQARHAGWPAPHLLAAGSRVCPELRCGACPEGQECDDAALAAAGPITELDGCFRVDAPGEVVWTVASPCGAPDQPPDRAVVQVVDPGDLAVAVYDDLDQFVAEQQAAGQGTVAHTGDAAWIAYPGWPLRLAAEAQVRLLVELTTGAGEFVAYDPAIAQLDWTPTAGRDPVVSPGAALEAVAFADTRADTTFTIADKTWPLGPVLGVSTDEAASLDLVAGQDPDGVPVYARAIVRDGDGAVLHGAPVTWSVDARAFAVALEEYNLDHVALTDCRPPEQRGGPREATLRARLGDLSAALTLRWTGVAGEADPNFAPDERCSDDACNCRHTGPDGLALLALALLLVRRRRRVSCPEGHLGSTCPPGHL